MSTPGGASGSRRRRVSPALVVWLTVVWIALWGTLSVANMVTGVVVALLVLVTLPMPASGARLAFHPLGVLVFVVLFAVDLVVSSLRVAWQAVGPRALPRNSVIEVALRTRSDLTLTMTVLALNVMPGSIVVEIHRGTPTRLFVHVLGADTPAAVESARRSVARLEQRVLTAFGTREELAAVFGPSGGDS